MAELSEVWKGRSGEAPIAVRAQTAAVRRLYDAEIGELIKAVVTVDVAAVAVGPREMYRGAGGRGSCNLHLAVVGGALDRPKPVSVLAKRLQRP